MHGKVVSQHVALGWWKEQPPRWDLQKKSFCTLINLSADTMIQIKLNFNGYQCSLVVFKPYPPPRDETQKEDWITMSLFWGGEDLNTQWEWS